MLRSGLCLIVVALACTSCGGGGSSSSDSGSATTDTGTATSADSGNSAFPVLTEIPSNNEGMASCLTTATVPAGSITGTVRYERVPIFAGGLNYDNIKQLPARGIVVEAVDAPAGTCTTTVVATAITNGNGEYSLDVARDRQVCVEARAQLYRSAAAGGSGWDVQVVDNTQSQAPYYLVDSNPATPADAPVRDLLASSGAETGSSTYVGPRAAAPFAILDSVCEAVDTVLGVDAPLNFPLLKINWSTNNVAAPGKLEDGDIGGSFFQESRYVDSNGNVVSYDRDIYLLGDALNNSDEYDPHVINHEYGHYLGAVFSRVDSIGGDHYSGDKLDPRVAFDEGFADAFAAISLDGASSIISDNVLYIDSLGPDRVFRFAVDRNYTSTFGWYSEATVYSTVYNTYDGSTSPSGGVGLGFGPIWGGITSSGYRDSDALETLFSFFHALKQLTTSAQNSAIDSLLYTEAIDPVSDDYGTGESVADNDVAGDPDVSPVYMTLQAGVQLQACSNNQFGVPNKLSNGRYIRFVPPDNRSYQFGVSPVDNGRPVIEIYRRGTLLASAESAQRGDAVSVDASLDGPVVVIIYDYDNKNSDGAAPGRYCFDVVAN